MANPEMSPDIQKVSDQPTIDLVARIKKQFSFSGRGEYQEIEESHEDVAFREVMIARMVDKITAEMKNGGLDEKLIDQITVNIHGIEDHELATRLLALPYEIWKRKIDYYKKEGLDAEAILDDLMETTMNIRKSYIGFHTSPNKITKSKSGPDEVTWGIKGTEYSDLSPVPQAYASSNFSSLYREKGPRYLYVVSIPQETWDERRTYINTRSRPVGYHFNANALSVVEEFDLDEIDKE